ncbi:MULTISPECIES: hypothetical protein [Streptomyces]|uniref:hypothetical protein n=1 Tax=Streptomyces TaxID=1883 RepID=UPI0015EF0A0D|nr:hypothetical protein [Streptomyces sp. WAC00263]
MTYRSTTLRLPDGKRTATVWKTWYRNSDGRYHGHYGFTAASWTPARPSWTSATPAAPTSSSLKANASCPQPGTRPAASSSPTAPQATST